MVIKARALFSDVFWQIPVAAADMIQLVKQINRISDCLPACIRSKIFCLVFEHLSCQHHSRKVFIYCNLDKRICLIIHQHGIVFRMMLFDQIAFQYQCLQF